MRLPAELLKQLEADPVRAWILGPIFICMGLMLLCVAALCSNFALHLRQSNTRRPYRSNCKPYAAGLFLDHLCCRWFMLFGQRRFGAPLGAGSRLTAPLELQQSAFCNSRSAFHPSRTLRQETVNANRPLSGESRRQIYRALERWPTPPPAGPASSACGASGARRRGGWPSPPGWRC